MRTWSRRSRIAFAAGAALALSVPAAAEEISKAEWIAGLKAALPAMFCKDGTYFRSCFPVSAKECESTATSATLACLEKHASGIPPMLRQPEDGSAWGEKVGGCAGNTFEQTYAGRKTQSEKCNDVNAWKWN